MSDKSYLPNPPTFGINGDKFPRWRNGQAEAVSDIICSPVMFDLCVGPTGFGKSLVYIAAALLSGKRVLVLTSTKALQSQLMADFGDICTEIKGRANYQCAVLPKTSGINGCDRGPCNWNDPCALKRSGCAFYAAARKARAARIVITNYSFWIYNNKSEKPTSSIIGDFDFIVCDEAHDAPDKIAGAFTSKFDGRNNVEREILEKFDWSDDIENYRQWASWAFDELGSIENRAKHDGNIIQLSLVHKASRKIEATQRYIDGGDSMPIIVPDKKNRVLQVALVWPYDMAREVLFKGASKIVLTSATVCPKTAQMLGVELDQYRLHEYPHSTPIERRLLYHIPCVRVNFSTTPQQMRTWLSKFETIARARSQWKGLFHTVSYLRRNFVYANTTMPDRLISHSKKGAMTVINKFKAEKSPKILVSPSIMTGYDFPGDTARWQVIGKIPYPNTSDPVVKARCTQDDDYAPYSAMQSLVQSCGRIVRSRTDWGESFIIDDNIMWFWKRYKHFAPEWFRGTMQRAEYAPAPKDWVGEK